MTHTRTWLSALAVVGVLALAPASASAQGSTQQGNTPHHSSTPANDFSVTYMFTHFFPEETYPFGFGFDMSHALSQQPGFCLRVVGSYQFYHSEFDNLNLILGGVRLGLHETPKMTPFIEVQAGLAKWGVTDFAIQYGAGADFKLGDSAWNIRVAGGVTTIIGNGNASNGFRVAGGFSRKFDF